MAVLAYPYLVMTDGTDTVTFADGLGGVTNFPPVRGQWAPAIPGLRTSPLAGRGPYADVTEDLSCNIRNTTAALCWDNLDTLSRLLDKAQRWWARSENTSPVILKYAPQGSTIHSIAAPMTALVLGRAGSDELNGVELPENVNDAGMLFEIYGVQVACLRRGPWIGASESASAGAAANPAILTITLPSTIETASPLKLSFTGFTTSAGTGTVAIPAGYMLIAPNDSFSLQQGEAGGTSGLAGGATYVSTADSAARASGGSVGRLNHNLASAGAESAITWTLPAAFSSATRLAVFCTYRNNAAVVWTLRAWAYKAVPASITFPPGSTTPLSPSATPFTTITAGPGNPTAIGLGTIASVNGFDTVQLRAATVSGSGTPTLDFDTILVVDLSTGLSYVITQQGMAGGIGAAFASKSAIMTVNYGPNTLRDPLCQLSILTTIADLPITMLGDTAICARGSVVQAVWYATHLHGATPYWTTQNNAGSAILSIGATITRQLAYLSPQ